MRAFPSLPALLAATALLVAGLAPSSAAAAVSVLTDDPNAHDPDVAVDEAGTAHVVWGTEDSLIYCRHPSSGGGCDVRHSLSLEGATNHPYINLLPSGELVITSEGHWVGDPGWDANGRVYAFTSTDGGASFAGPRIIADPDSIWGYGSSPEPGPGDSLLSFIGLGGGANTPLRYSAVPAAGTADEDNGAPTPSAGLTSWDNAGSPAIAFLGRREPIVASHDIGPGNSIYYRRWTGSGDINHEGSWLPEASLEGHSPQLAGGPKGVHMIYAPPESKGYGVARYNRAANAFGEPTTVSRNARQGFLAQDGDGTLHAVFTETANKNRLVSRSSTNGGQTWSRPVELADNAELPGGGGFPGDDFWDVRVGAALRGDGGAVVFSTNPGAGPILISRFGLPFEFRFVGRMLRIDPDRFARVRLACGRPEGSRHCRGQLTLRTRISVQGRLRPVTLAQREFKLKRRTSRTVALRLTPARLALLRGNRGARRRLAATARVRDIGTVHWQPRIIALQRPN